MQSAQEKATVLSEHRARFYSKAAAVQGLRDELTETLTKKKMEERHHSRAVMSDFPTAEMQRNTNENTMLKGEHT